MRGKKSKMQGRIQDVGSSGRQSMALVENT